MTVGSFFPQIASRPTFILTGDQDWAPDWALRKTLELVGSYDLPFHLFVTNPSEALSVPAEICDLTLGIHPNFLPDSTHGKTNDDILDACQELVPAATTVRCHAFAENTHILRQLVARGFSADSNLLSFLQPELVPIVHGAGLLRFPIFLEDDVLLDWTDGIPDVSSTLTDLLFTPGLKIFNFHPSLVALNVPDHDYYDRHRKALFGKRPAGNISPYAGRGIATVLVDLIDTVKAKGFDFMRFPDLVDAAYAELPDTLYKWPKRGSDD